MLFRSAVLALLPREAVYYFTRALVESASGPEKMAEPAEAAENRRKSRPGRPWRPQRIVPPETSPPHSAVSAFPERKVPSDGCRSASSGREPFLSPPSSPRISGRYSGCLRHGIYIFCNTWRGPVEDDRLCFTLIPDGKSLCNPAEGRKSLPEQAGLDCGAIPEAFCAAYQLKFCRSK